MVTGVYRNDIYCCPLDVARHLGSLTYSGIRQRIQINVSIIALGFSSLDARLQLVWGEIGRRKYEELIIFCTNNVPIY
jgi:hypothetical protein